MSYLFETRWNRFNATDVLKSWYEPFKGKKGKWNNLDEDFCTKNARTRDLDETTLKQLKQFATLKNLY